jgi:hypothetical protein
MVEVVMGGGGERMKDEGGGMKNKEDGEEGEGEG